MKTLKAICTAAILALALTVPAYAGDVHTPGFTAPPTTESSEPAATPSDLDDMSVPGLADILLVLVSIF